MIVPQVAFLSAGMTEIERAMAAMGVPTRGPSMASIVTAWNEGLKEIAQQAVSGSVKVGDLQIAAGGIIVMIMYDIETDQEIE